MKKIILLVIFIMAFNVATSKEIHHRIKVLFNEKFTTNNMHNFNLDFEEIKPGFFVVALIEEKDFKKINLSDLDFQILEENLEDNFEKICTLNNEKKLDDKIQHPNFFDFGSMGGYYKIEEIYSVFNKMKEKYPQYFVKEELVGESIEKRQIKSFIFGDKSLSKPKVLLNSLIHAREGGGLLAIVYYMWDLLERASNNDERAQFLLNNRSIYIIPLLNPDGVYYNQVTYPNGGGLWRKNRRMINDSTWGVDLNRNFGPYEYWNSSNFGSSDNPSDNIYRGKTPFSEPETQAFADYCTKNHFKTGLNYHTYSNLLIFPYSALNAETPDSALFRKMAIEMSKVNNYLFGTDQYTVGYSARGASDDWLYWTDGNKKKTLSFTPEVGTLKDNFWTTKDRILEHCYENMHTIDMIIWSAASNIRPTSLKIENKFEKYQSNLILDIKNLGVDDYLESGFVKIKSIDNNYKFETENIEFVNILSGDSTELRFNLPPPDDNFSNGTYIRFEVDIEQSKVHRKDTFNLRLFNYKIEPILSSGILLGKWDMGTWGFIYDENVGTYILTDSPEGTYKEKTDNYLTSIEPIDIDAPTTLAFRAYWKIEANYDFGVIEASIDNGLSWESLASERMQVASGIKSSKQNDVRKTGFHGFYPYYTEQLIDLSKYLGKKILLRFGVLSDPGSNLDGIFYEKIYLRKYENIKFTDINLDLTQKTLIIQSQTEESIIIKSTNESDLLDLRIYDILGNNVKLNKTRIDNDRIEIEISHLSKGVYFIESISNNKIKTKFIK